MRDNKWTVEQKISLVSLVKQGASLIELRKQFPERSSMALIFAVRALSSLESGEITNLAAKAKTLDQTLSKREAFSDSYMSWEDCDCERLKRYFLQTMSVKDIALNLGRTGLAVYRQMEKLYPREMDRQKLYEEVAVFVRFKPLNDTIIQ